MDYLRLLYLTTVLFVVSGCVPAIQKATPMQDTQINGDLEKMLALSDKENGGLVRDWWRLLGDTQLNRIVDESLVKAPSLQVLEARYAQANSIIDAIQSRNTPHIGANASVVRERFSENHIFPAPLGGSTNTQYMPQLVLDYDFDFWNERKSRISAAYNTALAQRGSIESAKIALSSAICELYVSWNYDEEKLDVLREMEQTINQERAIAERQYRLGLSDALAMNEKKATSLQVQQRTEELKRSIEGKKEALCVLGGFLPSNAQSWKRPRINDMATLPIPKEVVLNLLAHRPDVTVAKYTVLSKNYTIEESKAQYYPNISLSGAIGFTSFSFSKLIDHSSYTPSLGIALSLPLFDGGERDARLANSLSDYNALVYEYNGVVIKAANEVVMLLKQSKLLNRQQLLHHDEIAAHIANREIERKRLLSGLSNKLSYLSAQKTVQESQIATLSLNETKTLLQINLIKALGGGYTEDTNASR
ncbi:efflux transporter outer membrane subunit [Sulfuricurvum sp.]|uniref:efflux transporter outer membrane subunit n=1 Tax=Sulfuricurvum sp. TaxID=2025608 RepID=UPI00262B5C45|nr:efflux transporter outer membrane subunit [Sulfuricurvum sp.]MDD4950843.1 efflux transporter outer membrane subunit [Sulfuricurvum sp.]